MILYNFNMALAAILDSEVVLAVLCSATLIEKPHGFSMEFHGNSMEFHCESMEFHWEPMEVMGFPWKTE